MMTLKMAVRTWLLISLTITGCSSNPVGGPRLKTSPVTGTVHVDGEPAMLLIVGFYPESGTSELNHPVMATTDKDGKFSVGTYQTGDGLPAGKYCLVFKWQTFGAKKQDKLKGAYKNAFDDPSKSTFKVTVEEGMPNDLGIIELTTKK